MEIFKHFLHLNLSQDQEIALTKLETFLKSPAKIFMLKGYAGSGKTTILKGFVEYLNSKEKDFALMAPTGRAAKVIREKTGQEAYTIHKSIYSYEEMEEVQDGNSFYYYYKIRNNIDVTNKIFIVDEASMLSDAKSESEFFRFGTSHLLSDLITYTRVNYENVNSKIIFVGDPCQLPPVGDDSSKAFDSKYLKEKFGLISEDIEMKEVKRQGGESGILKAAAKIRKSITANYFNDFNLSSNDKDILNPTYESFLKTWQETAGTKIIIASKNKTCLDLNLQIRKLKFGNANLSIHESDTIIIGGNNYRKGIFNGEFAVVNEVSDGVETRVIALKGQPPVTLNWRNIQLIFPDNESNNKIVKGKILENFLYGDNYLKPEETQALYVDFRSRHKDLKPKTEEFKEAIMQDEYFNALLMKYGYAVTCHKSQGGEWDNVFTVWDLGNQKEFDFFNDKQLKRGKDNQGFYRWAYTAITRASKCLYALNPPSFNSYSFMTLIDSGVLDSLNELSGKSSVVEEIILNEELFEILKKFNLLEQPIGIQDHFINVWNVFIKQNIEIVAWQKLGYEIRYTFHRDSEKAVFKTFINGRNEFKNNFTTMPSYAPNEIFNNNISEIFNQLSCVNVVRNTTATILSKIEFDIFIEEKFPFTKSLYDDLINLLEGTKIRIDKIEHQQYKERYIFKRNSEIVVLDFEYNGDGFFGRILPLQNKINSSYLLSEIKSVLQILKEKTYAS